MSAAGAPAIPSAAIVSKQVQQPQLPSTASPVKRWLHEHTAVIKAAEVGLASLGGLYLQSGIRNWSIYETTFGAVLLGGAYLAEKFRPIFIPPMVIQKDKAFLDLNCRGVTLKYHGNLPILTIPKGVTPFDAGYARGYMMAAQIKEMRDKNDFAFFTLAGLPQKVKSLVQLIKKVIPDEYIQEMNGLVAGYMEKRKTWQFFQGKELTLDDLIYFHMIPDIAHMDFENGNAWAKQHLQDLGCTVVVDGDQETGPKAIRTVDWRAMDVYGKYSFVEFRETAQGVRTAGQSFPLFVGCLTGMNQHGLCVAMNVTRGLTDYPEELPAVFFLRRLIETCVSIKGENHSAERFLKQVSPLGPFNLSLVDSKDAVSVHFYQNEDRSHNYRWWTPGEQLVTLNFRYGNKGETNPTQTNSPQRKAEIEAHYQVLRSKGLYEMTDASSRLLQVSKGDEVNNIRTMTVAYFDPKEKIFDITFDNAYAGKQLMMSVPLKKWFDTVQ